MSIATWRFSPRRVCSRLYQLVARGRLARLIASAVQVASLSIPGATRSSKIIVFLLPGQDDFLTGGILSIFYLYRFSVGLSAIHNAKVLMCFYPGEGGRWRCRPARSRIMIYPFELAMAVCARAKSVHVHIPEYIVQEFLDQMGCERLAQLRQEHGLRINVLNQNALLMPSQETIERLREAVPELTCTTAHLSYTTAEYRRRWGVPVHYLPAWIYPSDPVVSTYARKRNLLIVSPDPSPFRDLVLQKISAELPHIKIQVISDMPFEKYLKLTQAAKWSLTFGEGLDDYFAAVSVRGGVGFAVYNDDFFTREYKDIRTIYPDWDTLIKNIVRDMRAMDNEEEMRSYTAKVRPLLMGGWSEATTRQALRDFYENKFTFP